MGLLLVVTVDDGGGVIEVVVEVDGDGDVVVEVVTKQRKKGWSAID